MPRLKKFLSDMGRRFDRNNYSTENSPARQYTVFGQIANSMNPQTAIMNASRNTKEYIENLEAVNDLNRYASYATAPLMIAAAPAESSTVFNDILLGNNYAASLAGVGLRPILGNLQQEITKKKKKHIYEVEGKHDSTRRHY